MTPAITPDRLQVPASHAPPWLAVHALTDPGRKRKHNEDAFWCHDAGRLVLVADGMGGHDAGEVASRTAINHLVAATDRGEGAVVADGGDDSALICRWQRLISDANQAIHDENAAQGHGPGEGMGTTLVGLWCLPAGDRAVVFHVGDSRVYRLRHGHLAQLTKDHSLYQMWRDMGGHGQPPPRNVILRALGLYPEVSADVRIEPLMPGDVYLLATDGLTDVVDSASILSALVAVSSAEGLAPAARRLIDAANTRSGRDNVTVALAMVTAR